MALIMKYIDSMHHYMDKYGGESSLLKFIVQSLKSTPVLIAVEAQQPIVDLHTWLKIARWEIFIWLNRGAKKSLKFMHNFRSSPLITSNYKFSKVIDV